MSEPSLKDRVLLFHLMQLPGQPQMMHMGTSYLVNDLAAEITRLTAALQKRRPFSDELAQKIIDVQVKEIDRLTAALDQREAYQGADHVIALEDEVTRLTAALAEATRPDARLERVLKSLGGEAERDRLNLSLGEALAYRSEDHGRRKKE